MIKQLLVTQDGDAVNTAHVIGINLYRRSNQESVIKIQTTGSGGADFPIAIYASEEEACKVFDALLNQLLFASIIRIKQIETTLKIDTEIKAAGGPALKTLLECAKCGRVGPAQCPVCSGKGSA